MGINRLLDLHRAFNPFLVFQREIEKHHVQTPGDLRPFGHHKCLRRLTRSGYCCETSPRHCSCCLVGCFWRRVGCSCRRVGCSCRRVGCWRQVGCSCRRVGCCSCRRVGCSCCRVGCWPRSWT